NFEDGFLNFTAQSGCFIVVSLLLRGINAILRNNKKSTKKCKKIHFFCTIFRWLDKYLAPKLACYFFIFVRQPWN
ncbi:MAG TPA: hypothetical protein DDX01_01380, partial [Holosporales bacterium]|nr:hypothetical protein [Holosporales bacterium]HBW25213.1 hypothetical protein [Holosporales bacterium]